jgi:hypothetical protein
MMTEQRKCPYCDGVCISVDDRDGACYLQQCVELKLTCQCKMIDEIVRLRSLVGKARSGPSFAEITKDLPRRSHEDASR